LYAPKTPLYAPKTPLYAPKTPAGHDEGERLHLRVITRNVSFFQRETSDTLKKKANHPMKKIPKLKKGKR